MKNSSFLTVIMILLLGLFSACGMQKTDSKKAVDEMEEAAEAVDEALEAKKMELKQDLKSMQLKVDNKLESLESDFEEATGEAKNELQLQIDMWKDKKRSLEANIDQLGENMANSWDDFEAKTRKYLDNLDKDLKGTVEDIKE